MKYKQDIMQHPQWTEIKEAIERVWLTSIPEGREQMIIKDILKDIKDKKCKTKRTYYQF